MAAVADLPDQGVEAELEGDPYPPPQEPGDVERYPLWYPITRPDREGIDRDRERGRREGTLVRWRDHTPPARSVTRAQIDRMWADWDLVRETRALEVRLRDGLDFLGLTAWSESQEARDLRRSNPAKYERVDLLWLDLLRRYEWKRHELRIRGIAYRAVLDE